MAAIVVALLFLLAAVVSGMAAYTGRKGWVTDPTKGYTVPERVRADPDLSRTANQLVATWCLLAAGLAVAPSVALLPTLLSDFRIEPSTQFLLVAAAYGVVVGAVARYPFERIRRL